MTENTQMMTFRSHSYRELPIPDLSPFIEAKKKGISCPINQNDSEQPESLVNIVDYNIAGANHYFQNWNPPYYQSIPGSIDKLLIRESIAEKLRQINQRLDPIGLEIYVFDAYRPQSVQSYFSKIWFPNYLREKHPNMDEKWIQQEVQNYWALGAASMKELLKKIPPHSTGGAIDMSLRHIESGFLIEMGSLFDDVTSVAHTNYFEELYQKGEDLGFTQVEALKNRRFLFHLMKEAGFASNPNEWWHFSFGDEMWAVFGGHSSALFGYAGKQAGEELL